MQLNTTDKDSGSGNRESPIAINILLTVDNYLVCGNDDGTIRFYDVYFKAEAWFED